jgi:membrane fusion protein, heavy metal efflux system
LADELRIIMLNTYRIPSVRRLPGGWLTAVHYALAMWLLAAAPSAAFAHEGHDHDKPAPLNLPIAPRVVAITPDYELVGVLSGEQRLTIFLHRFATGEPVKGAKLTASAGESEVPAVAKEDGIFEISAPWIAAAESVDIIFSLTLPNDQDILTGRLERTTAARASGGMTPTSANQSQQVIYVGIGALMTGVLLTLLIGGGLARRRQLAGGQQQDREAAESTSQPQSQRKRLQRASLMLLAALLVTVVLALVSDPAKAEQSPNLPSVPATMATDQPQRMADGSLFVPKATQHLLSVRTILTAETKAPRTEQLAGAVIADPHSFGRVQAARPGRVAGPDGGLAFVGKRVGKGELLGLLLPYIEQADKANIESQIAEAEARIAKLRTILSRYNERPGAVPQVKVDEVEGELDALVRKRAELRPSLVVREEIRAPISGTISVANVVTGQIVEAREVLFEIVDPTRFWVEAIAHDARVVANLSKAVAITNGGERLPLEFAGIGLALKQQAAPLTFRVTEAEPNLSIGKPVTVILQSTVQLSGIVLPASSVVRASSGLAIVWVKTEPERFEPHTVRYEALDGQRVVVLAGLKADMRVVTEGATLLNQIR